MTSCRLFGICGGCQFEDSYEEQLSKKEMQLKELLSSCVDEDSIWEGILPSPLPEGYRNKMEYSFGDEVKDGPLTLGMHKKKSFYSVVHCDDCQIVHPDFNRIVNYTRDFFEEKGRKPFHKKLHVGYLRYLVLRRSYATGQVLADLVTTSRDTTIRVATDPEQETEPSCCGADRPMSGSETEDLREWKEGLLALGCPLAGILHTVDDSVADAVKDEGTEVLYGQDFIEEELLGLRFRISPFSFFQTNSKGAEVLYGKVREYAGDTTGKTVYDLYSGTGTIAQLVAAVAEKVYGVEIVEEAVEAAKINAAANGLTNCEFLAGDVLQVIDSLEKKPDRIILDPPRDGLHPKMLPKIIGYGVKNIVYVACKPASFVRDFPAFAQAGYRIRRACAVDMFPRTKNVELVALLERRKTE